MTVVGVVVCVVPSYFIVTPFVAPKPVPETVTVEPTLPVKGLKVMAGITVKVPEIELELASVTVTVLAPAVDPVIEFVGILKEALNEPVAFVDTVAGVVVIVSPAYVIVMAELPEKPLPDTETDVLTGPVVGLRVTDGVTSNVAVAVLWLMLLSMALIVCTPAVAEGTVKDVEMVPLPVEVVDVTVAESNFIVTPELWAKPLPETATEPLTVLVAGFSCMYMSPDCKAYNGNDWA